MCHSFSISNNLWLNTDAGWQKTAAKSFVLIVCCLNIFYITFADKKVWGKINGLIWDLFASVFHIYRMNPLPTGNWIQNRTSYWNPNLEAYLAFGNKLNSQTKDGEADYDAGVVWGVWTFWLVFLCCDSGLTLEYIFKNLYCWKEKLLCITKIVIWMNLIYIVCDIVMQHCI